MSSKFRISLHRTGKAGKTYIKPVLISLTYFDTLPSVIQGLMGMRIPDRSCDYVVKIYETTEEILLSSDFKSRKAILDIVNTLLKDRETPT